MNKSRVQQILLHLTTAILVASCGYEWWSHIQNNNASFRSLTVQLDQPPVVQQPWEIYYHTRAGYTALETQEAIAEGTVLTFPITTTNIFTKIRLDPGKKKVQQKFCLQKIALSENGTLVQTFSDIQLPSLVKPLNQIQSFQYDPTKAGIIVSTKRRGDPQLELDLSSSDFNPLPTNNKHSQILFTLFLGLATFLLLYFWEPINSIFQDYLLGSIISYDFRFLIGWALGTSFIFMGLQHREKLFPQKYLVVEMGKTMSIPQDNWKIYLDVGGYKEVFSRSGHTIGDLVKIPIPTEVGFSKIRIDPGQSEQDFQLKRIQIKSGWENILEIEGQALFNIIKPLNQLENIGFDAKENLTAFQTSRGDPFFEVQIGEEDCVDKSNLFELIVALGLGLLTVLIGQNWRKVRQQFQRGTWLINSLFLINGAFLILQFWNLGEAYYGLLLINVLWLFLLPGLAIKQFSSFQGETLLANFLLSLGFGVGVVLMCLFITYAINIPHGEWLSIGIALGLGMIYLIKQKAQQKPSLFQQFKSYLRVENLLLFTFFNILFGVFISPIGDLLCPPLHDPAVIATISHEIQSAGFIKNAIHRDLWNYPPYLQLMTALLSKVSFLSSPKTILILTNLGIILSGFAFGLFWQQYFKNKYTFYISTLLFLFIAPTIPELYFTAGKNAMIFSFIYWFLLLSLLPQLLADDTNKMGRKGLSFALLVITAFQFHYAVIFILPIFFVFFLQKGFKDLWQQPKEKLRQYVTLAGGLIIPGILFGAFIFFQLNQAAVDNRNNLFYAKTTSEQEKKQVAKSKNLTIESPQKKEVLKQKDLLLNQPSKHISTAPIKNKKQKITTTKTDQPKQPKSKKEIKKKYEKRKNRIFIPTPAFMIKSFGELLKNNAKDYSLFKYQPIYSWTWLALLLLFFVTKRKREIGIISLFAITIILLNNSNIYNLVHYTEVLFFMVPLLVAGFLLNFILDKIQFYKPLVFVILLALTYISIKQASYLYNKYYDYKYYSTLTQADLNAFEFIDKNLAGKGHFLPLNISNLNKSVPAQGDGSLYLNLSQEEAILSYVPGKLISINDPKYRQLRLAMYNWKQGYKGSEGKLLVLLKSLNVKYLYSGAFVPWGRQVSIESILNSPFYSLVYDQGGVQIFEIK